MPHRVDLVDSIYSCLCSSGDGLLGCCCFVGGCGCGWLVGDGVELCGGDCLCLFDRCVFLGVGEAGVVCDLGCFRGECVVDRFLRGLMPHRVDLRYLGKPFILCGDDSGSICSIFHCCESFCFLIVYQFLKLLLLGRAERAVGCDCIHFFLSSNSDFFNRYFFCRNEGIFCLHCFLSCALVCRSCGKISLSQKILGGIKFFLIWSDAFARHLLRIGFLGASQRIIHFLEHHFSGSFCILSDTEINASEWKCVLQERSLIAHTEMHIICRADAYRVFSSAFRDRNFFTCKRPTLAVWCLLCERFVCLLLGIALWNFDDLISSVCCGHYGVLFSF